jgi:hypothetical protein
MKDYIYYIYELACGLLDVLLNVATIGTFGNIMTFLAWDDDDREKYEPVYHAFNMSENGFKWLIAVTNTLLIGIPQGIISTIILVNEFVTKCKLLKDAKEKEAEA